MTLFLISALLSVVDAPAFLDGQEKLRLSLLKKLAEAIKEVSSSVCVRWHEVYMCYSLLIKIGPSHLWID